MLVAEILSCLGVIAVAIVLYLILVQVRSISESLVVIAEASKRTPAILPLTCTHHDGTLLCRWPTTYHSVPLAPRDYAVWSWTGQEWELDTASLDSGAAPGSPPQFPGAYPGQSVKMECR